jgi:hypothetical protein
MSCQSQPDLVVANVNIRMMIHHLSQPCHSIEKSHALLEVLEDIEFRYLLPDKLPAREFRQFSSDLKLLQPHTTAPAKRILLLRSDMCVYVVGLHTCTSDFLVYLPKHKEPLVCGRVS